MHLEEIEQDFGITVSAAGLALDPFYATFLRAPEIAAWRASHP